MSNTNNAQSDTLSGVLPVFQTPFQSDESIDYHVLEREIDWLVEQGADGLVMAMVSETLRLGDAERNELAAAACRFAAGRVPVVISVGAESTYNAVLFTRHTESCGAAAVMAIPPVATALGDEQLESYYERILAATSLPVVVQDASGYVGRPLSIDVQSRLLARHGPARVMFKPEANPIGPRLSALRDATGGAARIFEGSGGITLVDSFRRGITGTMPAAELIDVFVVLWRALTAGDDATVYRLAPLVASLVALQTSLDAFLAVEKYLLVKRGIFTNSIVRGPAGYQLDSETRSEVDRLFERLMQEIRAS